MRWHAMCASAQRSKLPSGRFVAAAKRHVQRKAKRRWRLTRGVVGHDGLVVGGGQLQAGRLNLRGRKTGAEGWRLATMLALAACAAAGSY